MTESKIYCLYCRSFNQFLETCSTPTNIGSTWRSGNEPLLDPRTKNRGNDCSDFDDKERWIFEDGNCDCGTRS